jgi:hypothetical protein
MTKLKNGAIYGYRSKIVRLHKQTGATAVYRTDRGQIKIGRADLFRKVSKEIANDFRDATR